MERTEYFNYTRPSETQLNNTEDSKVRGILRRARSNFQFGTKEGFRITINAANALQIDIGAGDGFTGGFYKSENLRGSPNSGERISTLTDTPTGSPGYTKTAEGVGLVDYSANTKNYVCLKYTEAGSITLAERYYPFSTHNTIISETYLVEVYTEVQWNALTTAELETRILVGIITAQGAGNPLSLANIQQMIQPKDHPIAGTQPSNITGVALTGVSEETIIGSGTFRFETATKKLYWTAPGDAEGIGVVISSSGVYTIYSDDTSYWIFIEVIFAGLPVADVTDIIRVESLYGRAIPMACAVDQAHRDMLGTGVLSETNAHAISIDDITGGTFEHADLYHINGISGDANTDQLECSINVATDSIEIVNNGSMKNSFLIDGISYDVLTGYAAGIPGSLSFDIIPAPTSGDYLIYVDSKGNPQYVKIAEYAPLNIGDTQVLFSPDIAIMDMHNQVAGTGRLDWDATNERLRWSSPADGGDALGYGPSVYLMGASDTTNSYGFYKVYSQNLVDWILVICTGTAPLGISAASTFNIDKNETQHPDDSLLKIGIVTWNVLGEIHATMRDIRRFNTSDNREEVEEEHDENGCHTKVIKTWFRARATKAAIYGRAIVETGVFGEAFGGATGVYGSASSDYGVYGLVGANYGVFGSAAGAYGVYGKANGNYAIYGTTPNNYGVYGGADGDYGVRGSAGNNYGVRGDADGAFGVYGAALANVGVGGSAAFDYGVYAEARGNYGVYGTADGDYGVRGEAGANYGVRGDAAGNYGVYGNAAVNSGVVGIAGGIVGVAGFAPATGGKFEAQVGNYGVSASAAADTAIYGSAVNDVGMCGKAGNDYGVYGSAAGNYGGYFVAPAANVTGIVGIAQGNGATGIYGRGGAAGFGVGGDFLGCFRGIQVNQNGADGCAIYGSAFDPSATALHLDEGLFRYDYDLSNDAVDWPAGAQAVPDSCRFVYVQIGGIPYRFAVFAI